VTIKAGDNYLWYLLHTTHICGNIPFNIHYPDDSCCIRKCTLGFRSGGLRAMTRSEGDVDIATGPVSIVVKPAQS